MIINGKKGYRFRHLIYSLSAAVLLILLTAAVCSGDCPALPPPSGNTVVVDTVGEIWDAVNTATPGDTILVADGTYNLGAAGRYIWVDVENVTIRSQSGNRDDVIFDDNYQGTEIITVTASNVTIADMTIKRARTNAVHVVSAIVTLDAVTVMISVTASNVTIADLTIKRARTHALALADAPARSRR